MVGPPAKPGAERGVGLKKSGDRRAVRDTREGIAVEEFGK